MSAGSTDQEKRGEIMLIYQDDIVRALRALGVEEGDTVLVHSSLKSAGYIVGGADTVIKAFTQAIGDSGTLVMPTLSQKNFEHAYEEWSLDRPSDVGLITETFRKSEGALRSDQATHSVAAKGPLAREITGSHTDYGPLYGAFGDYAFSESSPWKKMYEHKGKIVFFGVTMKYNTYKHFVEYRFVRTLLEGIQDKEKRAVQKSRLACHTQEHGKDVIKEGIWPYYSAIRMQEALEGCGMVKKAPLGNTELLCVDICETCDFAMEQLLSDPDRWYKDEVLAWIKECK